jgi:hypothetical protein
MGGFAALSPAIGDVAGNVDNGAGTATASRVMREAATPHDRRQPK